MAKSMGVRRAPSSLRRVRFYGAGSCLQPLTLSLTLSNDSPAKRWLRHCWDSIFSARQIYRAKTDSVFVIISIIERNAADHRNLIG
jgi:hypothetical protein